MKTDILIIAASKNDELIKITQNAIDSCGMANVYVIETHSIHKYKGAKVLKYSGQFNYNKCINFGISKTSGDVIGVFNNDVLFTKNWYNRWNCYTITNF